MRNLLLVLLLAAMAWPVDKASAQRRPPPPTNGESFVINLRDARFGGGPDGRDSIIFIEQEITRAYPRVRLRDYQLSSIVLTAKSQFGRGSVDLIIGGQVVDSKAISGSPRDFENPSRRTFTDVELQARGRTSDLYSAQIQLKGNIVARQMIVYADRWDSGGGGHRPPPPGGGGGHRPPPPGDGGGHRPPPPSDGGGHRPPPDGPRLQIIDVGSVKLEKFRETGASFQVNRDRVYEVRIVADGDRLEVRRASVRLHSGQIIYLSDLLGQYREGEMRVAYINGEFVQSIDVSGVSTNTFGTKGIIRAQVGI